MAESPSTTTPTTATTAPSSTATRPATLEVVVSDSALRISHDDWFSLLQDEGTAMTLEEKEEFRTPTKGRKKHKSKNISYDEHFFPDLYNLSSMIWGIIDAHRDLFPRFPKANKNSSSVFHVIGEIIAKKRTTITRGDVHNIGREGATVIDIIQNEKYSNKLTFFWLSQASLLEHLFEKYGPEPEKKKVTVDDKVRLAGIMINDEQIRTNYIADLIGKTKDTGIRSDIDRQPSASRAGFLLLHTKFIDKEVRVMLPDEWLSDATRVSINNLRGEGAYERHGNFNPNNIARIALPWTLLDIIAIFKLLKAEYMACMEKYTMGTGGGPGAAANFSVWESRDATCVVSYTQQESLMYLSVVHMWDREQKYPFVKRKAPMPRQAMIEDGRQATVENGPVYDVTESDDECNGGEEISRQLSFTPANTQPSSASLSGTSKKQRVYSTALSQLNAGREAANKHADKITSLLEKMCESDTASGKMSTLMKDMQVTMDMIKNCKSEVVSIREKMDTKRSSDKRLEKKLTKKLKAELQQQKKMIGTLQSALEEQRKQLQSMTKTKNHDSESDDDDSISDEDDSDDDDHIDENDKDN